MPKWYQSKIIKIEDASSTTKRFWLEVQGEDEILQYKAGQFVTCDLPISDRRQKRWRSYSIANAPDQSNIIELCIVYLENGLGSDYLWNEARVGTEIKFKEPAGTFTLPKIISDDIVMICTGTGVAPFRSMITDIYNNDKSHNNLHLIFGTRTKDGILYYDELRQLSEKYPEFRYDIALSRENVVGTSHGYIHDIYLKEYTENVENKKFYLCGWTGMIDDAVANLLLKLKVDKSQIIYELYG